MKKYEYMPRITIIPGKYEKERIDEAVRCCEKYGYDEIMFFINGENLFQGFMKKEDIKPLVETIKRAKAELDKIGVKTSINPWTSLGHGERGKLGLAKDHFKKMVGDKGFENPLNPCPLDEEFLDYLGDYFCYIVEETKPNMIWVEDEFRLNHGLNRQGNEWGSGCFCPEHMKLYSAHIGREVTIDEMRVGMAKNLENGAFRKAFFDVNRKVMNDFAVGLGERVHKKYPDVKIGLMVGDAKSHSMEGRDWKGMLRGFAGKNKPAVRIHGPMIRQFLMQDYCWYFNDISMQARALVPEETVVLPEVENAMFSPYTKSVNATRFQLEVAQALCPSGMTLDIDCFAGNGIVDAYGLGQPLKDIKPYLTAFLNEPVEFKHMDGISVPATEDGFLRCLPADTIGQIKNGENYWAGHLASQGIAFKYDTSKKFENKIVAISGGYLRDKSVEEIEELFEKNYLILDGESVTVLFEKGLNRLIRAKSYKQCVWDKGEFSFEEAVEGKKYLGINGARTSSIVTCPDCLVIEYDEQPTVYTNLMGYEEEYIAPCMVSFDNCFIMPYMATQPAIYSPVIKEKHHGLLTTMREEVLKEALSSVKGYDSPVLFNRLPYVTTYYYKTEQADYLLLVNFSDDSYGEIRLTGLPSYKKASVCQRKDGKWKKVCIKEGKINVKGGLPATTTLLVRLEK